MDVESPKGTIYVWAPVPEGYTSTSFVEHVLDKAEVLISPGSMYGAGGEGFFRISAFNSRENVLEVVRRLSGMSLPAAVSSAP